MLGQKTLSRRTALSAIAASGLLTVAACTNLAPAVPAGGAQQPTVAQSGTNSAAPVRSSQQAGQAQQVIPPVPPGSVPVIPPTNSVVVVGEGIVRARPDMAIVSTGVETRGPTARQAQDANTAAMTAVIDRLKALGIAEDDIRTSGISLSPVYGREENRIEEYRASNSVSVTIRDIARAGEVLDAAVTAGANLAGGIQFTIAESGPQRQQALQEAVQASRAKADIIAAAAGLQVTGIQSLTEEGIDGIPRPEAMAMPAMAQRADVPVQPGQLTITARVRAVYIVG